MGGGGSPWLPTVTVVAPHRHHQRTGINWQPAALLACASLLLTSCALNEIADDAAGTGTATGSLNGIGASSMSVAQENWIAGFQTENPRATVIYAPEGSGAGRDAFMGGGADFAGSDRAFHLSENVVAAFAGCAVGSRALDLPVYISPIAVVFHVDGVKDLNLTPDVLAGVFNGTISTWSDPAIAALNPGAALPDLQITAVHRSDNSGTTENFTSYLRIAASSVWEDEADDTWPLQGGEAAKGTSGVLSAVRDGVGTIGYVDASQAGDTATAAIGKVGAFELPTAEAAARAVEAAPVEEGRSEHDLALQLDADAPGYPIVLVSYALACERYDSPEKAQLVKEYLGWVASVDGQQSAADKAGAAPLSPVLRDKVLAAIDSIG